MSPTQAEEAMLRLAACEAGRALPWVLTLTILLALLALPISFVALLTLLNYGWPGLFTAGIALTLAYLTRAMASALRRITLPAEPRCTLADRSCFADAESVRGDNDVVRDLRWYAGKDVTLELTHTMKYFQVALCLAALLLHPGAIPAADDIDTAASLLEILLDADPDSARKTLATLSEKVQTGELDAKQTAALEARLGKTLQGIYAKGAHPLAFDAALLAAAWKEKEAIATVRQVVESKEEPVERRAAGFAVLVTTDEGTAIAAKLLSDAKTPLALRTLVLSALGRSDSPQVVQVVLASYAKYEPELQPKAVELLTQRVSWSKSLLAAIGEGKIPDSRAECQSGGEAASQSR